LFLFVLHCFNATWIRSALISETRSRFITKQKLTGLKSIELHFTASCALQRSPGFLFLFFSKQDNAVLEIHAALFNGHDIKFRLHATTALSQITTGSGGAT